MIDTDKVQIEVPVDDMRSEVSSSGGENPFGDSATPPAEPATPADPAAAPAEPAK